MTEPSEPKPKKKTRVLLPTQRVEPETKEKLERMRTPHKGIGRAIDYCVKEAKE